MTDNDTDPRHAAPVRGRELFKEEALDELANADGAMGDESIPLTNALYYALRAIAFAILSGPEPVEDVAVATAPRWETDPAHQALNDARYANHCAVTWQSPRNGQMRSHGCFHEAGHVGPEHQCVCGDRPNSPSGDRVLYTIRWAPDAGNAQPTLELLDHAGRQAGRWVFEESELINNPGGLPDLPTLGSWVAESLIRDLGNSLTLLPDEIATAIERASQLLEDA